MRLMIRKAMLKLRGSRRYEYLSEYERLQWQPLETIENYQFARLKKILNHAYETIPYYRDVFKELGVHPGDIKTRTDFSRLPVLTKDIIKARKSDLISTLFNPKTLIVNSSGGSTGEPLQFYQEKDVYEQTFANWMLGLKMAGWNERGKIISIWGNQNDLFSKPGIAQRLKQFLSKNMVLNAYKYNEANFDSWARTIINSGEVYIYGYPSAISDFAQFIRLRKIDIENVKSIQTSAEQLLPEQRAILEEVFKCQIFDQYGSRECPGIACECDHGRMHLFCHSTYVEFVDDPGAPDGSKKLIVTPLTSYAMPFIRYEIGDLALPLEEKCSCGRGLPLMEMKIGRIYDRFVYGNGQVVHGTLLVRQVAGIRGIKNFQFHQKDTGNIDLNIVQTTSFNDSDDEDVMAIHNNISKLLGSDVKLNINYVDAIPQTIGGKHRQFISDVRFK